MLKNVFQMTNVSNDEIRVGQVELRIEIGKKRKRKGYTRKD